MSVNLKKVRLGVGTEQGGVLILVLVLMIVFIVIATYSLRFIVRQSHEIINQENEEQAFWAADSGVSYAAWLLAPGGGNISPNQIVNADGITDHIITDDLGRMVGMFDLVDIVSGDQTIELRSVGFGTAAINSCQTIAAELRQLRAGDPYVITQWNHEVGEGCL